LGEEKFTLCPIAKHALNMELKNISEKISKLKQSEDLLKSFLIKGKVE
jgi:hypothetical protein